MSPNDWYRPVKQIIGIPSNVYVTERSIGAIYGKGLFTADDRENMGIQIPTIGMLGD
jgi:hypothetical protein